METAVVRGADETAECRRLAELLNLDAVGLMRTGASSRRIAWWAAPGSGPLPLHLDDVLEGRAQGWIACPRGDDLVFARLTPESSVRSVAALRGMLSSLAGQASAAPDDSDDPYAKERTRWAYAIHDGLTQVVTASVLELEWMARRVELDPSQATAALAEAALELRRALEEIRRMLAALSPEGSPQEEPLELAEEGLVEDCRVDGVGQEDPAVSAPRRGVPALHHGGAALAGMSHGYSTVGAATDSRTVRTIASEVIPSASPSKLRMIR